MAPSTAARAAAKDENDPAAAKLAVWKEALYDKVRESGRENDLFSQEDLTDLGVLPPGDGALLLQVIQALSNDKLFVTFKDHSGRIGWKWRDVQEAHKLVPSPRFGVQTRCVLTVGWSLGTSSARTRSRPWCTP